MMLNLLVNINKSSVIIPEKSEEESNTGIEQVFGVPEVFLEDAIDLFR